MHAPALSGHCLKMNTELVLLGKKEETLAAGLWHLRAPLMATSHPHPPPSALT